MGTKKFAETKGERTTSKTLAHTRILSIDILRGFSIVIMVLIHFGLYYGNVEATHNFIIFFLSHGLADWGAAIFLMMMGMSQVLSAKRIGK
jgi:uncharacterized membrane protein